MFNFLDRIFASWHRIPKHKVPRWVRGSLYKHRYVKDGGREYRVNIQHQSKQKKHVLDNGFAMSSGGSIISYSTKKWKEVKYYYRNL